MSSGRKSCCFQQRSVIGCCHCQSTVHMITSFLGFCENDTAPWTCNVVVGVFQLPYFDTQLPYRSAPAEHSRQYCIRHEVTTQACAARVSSPCAGRGRSEVWSYRDLDCCVVQAARSRETPSPLMWARWAERPCKSTEQTRLHALLPDESGMHELLLSRHSADITAPTPCRSSSPMCFTCFTCFAHSNNIVTLLPSA